MPCGGLDFVLLSHLPPQLSPVVLVTLLTSLFLSVHLSKVYHRHFAMSIYQKADSHIIFILRLFDYRKNFRKHASFVDFICDCGIIILTVRTEKTAQAVFH